MRNRRITQIIAEACSGGFFKNCKLVEIVLLAVVDLRLRKWENGLLNGGGLRVRFKGVDLRVTAREFI